MIARRVIISCSFPRPADAGNAEQWSVDKKMGLRTADITGRQNHEVYLFYYLDLTTRFSAKLASGEVKKPDKGDGLALKCVA